MKYILAIILALVLVSGCITSTETSKTDGESIIEANQVDYSENKNKSNQECEEVPMKYNIGNGVTTLHSGATWIGDEEDRKGLDWISPNSLLIRNMETEESGLWKVIFKIETQDGVKQLERSRYIYPGESYNFEATFGIKDPYRNCEGPRGDCLEELVDMPNPSYEILSPTKLVCEK